jgi:hypothetical protein
MSTHQNDAERLLTRLAFNQFTLAGTTALEDVSALADLGYSGLSPYSSSRWLPMRCDLCRR